MLTFQVEPCSIPYPTTFNCNQYTHCRSRDPPETSPPSYQCTPTDRWVQEFGHTSQTSKHHSRYPRTEPQSVPIQHTKRVLSRRLLGKTMIVVTTSIVRKRLTLNQKKIVVENPVRLFVCVCLTTLFDTYTVLVVLAALSHDHHYTYQQSKSGHTQASKYDQNCFHFSFVI